ncbi:Uncharacterized protein Fot_24721 [Forsythia ovata]|uniref:Uncharacterized protein n=1 Tax=Forsythia ovata TaxID=205694 RepID=A0ABD1U722_9LAMI
MGLWMTSTLICLGTLTRCRWTATRLLGFLQFPTSAFQFTHARLDVEVMRSYIFSHMSEGLSNRRIEDIEKVLAVYNKKVLTLQDYLVRAIQRLVTNMKIVEDEKSKEVNHLEKRISSLKKCCEASEARAKE